MNVFWLMKVGMEGVGQLGILRLRTEVGRTPFRQYDAGASSVSRRICSQ